MSHTHTFSDDIFFVSPWCGTIGESVSEHCGNNTLTLLGDTVARHMATIAVLAAHWRLFAAFTSLWCGHHVLAKDLRFNEIPRGASIALTCLRPTASLQQVCFPSSAPASWHPLLHRPVRLRRLQIWPRVGVIRSRHASPWSHISCLTRPASMARSFAA